MLDKELTRISLRTLIEEYRYEGRRDFANHLIFGDMEAFPRNEHFININFQGYRFFQVSFESAIFDDANFINANLEQINFRNSNLMYVNFSNAELREANFQYAKLARVILNKSCLKHAQLQHCNLEGAKLIGADLSSANFRYAYLEGANLKGAKVSGTNFSQIQGDIEKLLDEKQRKQAQFEEDSIYISSKLPAQQFDLSGIPSSKEPEKIIKEIKKDFQNRQGQPQFRKKLINAYNKCCAISGCDIEETLEAAHIIPYCLDKNNDVNNGLLLRADLHTLFDLNLIKINPDDYTIYLDFSLQSSKIYAKFHCKKLHLPRFRFDYPSNTSLKWRYENYHKYAPTSSS